MLKNQLGNGGMNNPQRRILQISRNTEGGNANASAIQGHSFIGPIMPDDLIQNKVTKNNKETSPSPRKVVDCNLFPGIKVGKQIHSLETSPILEKGRKRAKIAPPTMQTYEDGGNAKMWKCSPRNSSTSSIRNESNTVQCISPNTDWWDGGNVDVRQESIPGKLGMLAKVKHTVRSSSQNRLHSTPRSKENASSCQSRSSNERIVSPKTGIPREIDFKSGSLRKPNAGCLDAIDLLNCSSSSWQSIDDSDFPLQSSSGASTGNVHKRLPSSDALDTSTEQANCSNLSSGNITLSKCNLDDTRQFRFDDSGDFIPPENCCKKTEFFVDGDCYTVEEGSMCAVVEKVEKVDKPATCNPTQFRNVVFSQEDENPKFVLVDYSSDSDQSSIASADVNKPQHITATHRQNVSTHQQCSLYDLPGKRALLKQSPSLQTRRNITTKTPTPSILETKPLNFIETEDNEKPWYERSFDDLNMTGGGLNSGFEISRTPPPPPPTPSSGTFISNPNNSGSAFSNQCIFWSLDYWKTIKQGTSARQPLLSTPPPNYTESIFSPTSVSPSQASIVRERRWLNVFQNRFGNCTFGYVDTHCHLDFLYKREGFRGTFAKYMQTHADMFPDCFEGCVAVFCEPSSFRSSGGLWMDLLCEGNVWGAMGCHPKSATDFTAYAADQLNVCMHHNKMMALGEIGLDYSGKFEGTKDIQKQVFVQQIRMAQAHDKPLVVHCRQAEDDCFEIMKQYVGKEHKIHRHCFTKDWEEAKRWLDTFPNLYLGLTPVVTYRTATEVHDVARNIPLDRLLLETDAPYFLPNWIPRDEMKLSHPGMAIYVADEVAKLQCTSLYNVLLSTRDNTKKMYGV